jgi:hypothetical protein
MKWSSLIGWAHQSVERFMRCRHIPAALALRAFLPNATACAMKITGIGMIFVATVETAYFYDPMRFVRWPTFSGNFEHDLLFFVHIPDM